MAHGTQGVILLHVPVKVIDAARPGYIQLLCYADFLHHRLCFFFWTTKIITRLSWLKNTHFVWSTDIVITAQSACYHQYLM